MLNIEDGLNEAGKHFWRMGTPKVCGDNFPTFTELKDESDEKKENQK